MRLWCHLEEGLALGFSERPVLDGWMWLRLQYPDALPVRPLSGALSRSASKACVSYGRTTHPELAL